MADVFQFYSGSADAKPGKGLGDSVADSATYTELAAIPGWRKMLSNFAETEFRWKGLTWATVEHAAQAAKVETSNPELFRSFAKESGSDVSKASAADAQRVGVAMKLSKQEKDAWAQQKPVVMKELWTAKFSQHEPAKRVLLLTGNAQLFHKPAKVPGERWEGLEEVRQELRIPVSEGEGDAEEEEEGKEEEDVDAFLEQEDVKDAATDTAAAAAAAPTNKSKNTKKQNEIAIPSSRIPLPPKLTKTQAVAHATMSNVGALPVSAVAEGLPQTTSGQSSKKEETSTLRFCPTCRGYLFLKSTDQSLTRNCRICGFTEEDTKGGLILEMMVQERSSEAYKILINEYTRQDPTLAHIRGPIKCPNGPCASNTSGKERDVIPMRYDEKKLKYLYICDVCGYQWRSRD